MDPTTTLRLLSVGRIALGLGLVVDPERVGGSWIGRAAADDPTKIAVRGLGIRDVAIGAATLGALQSTGMKGKGTRILAALAIACDLVDAASTLAAGKQVPGRGLGSAAVAGGAAVAGAAALVARDDSA